MPKQSYLEALQEKTFFFSNISGTHFKSFNCFRRSAELKTSGRIFRVIFGNCWRAWRTATLIGFCIGT